MNNVRKGSFFMKKSLIVVLCLLGGFMTDHLMGMHIESKELSPDGEEPVLKRRKQFHFQAKKGNSKRKILQEQQPTQNDPVVQDDEEDGLLEAFLAFGKISDGDDLDLDSPNQEKENVALRINVPPLALPDGSDASQAVPASDAGHCLTQAQLRDLLETAEKKSSLLYKEWAAASKNREYIESKLAEKSQEPVEAPVLGRKQPIELFLRRRHFQAIQAGVPLAELEVLRNFPSEEDVVKALLALKQHGIQ